MERDEEDVAEHDAERRARLDHRHPGGAGVFRAKLIDPDGEVHRRHRLQEADEEAEGEVALRYAKVELAAAQQDGGKGWSATQDAAIG